MTRTAPMQEAGHYPPLYGVRTPFAITEAEEASVMYGGSTWQSLVEEMRRRHEEAVAEMELDGYRFGETIIETIHSFVVGGRQAEWRTPLFIGPMREEQSRGHL